MPSTDSVLVAADQPITAGSAPGSAPTIVDSDVRSLERRVEQHVARRRQERYYRGQRVDEIRQFRRADHRQHDAERRAFRNRHPSIGHRPLCGAPHQSIGGALPHLIQGRGAAGDEERAEQRVREIDQRGIRWRAERIGRGHGQQDQEVQARLGQRDVVAGARVRLDDAVRWSLDGR